jgi:hypothetical protein
VNSILTDADRTDIAQKCGWSDLPTVRMAFQGFDLAAFTGEIEALVLSRLATRYGLPETLPKLSAEDMQEAIVESFGTESPPTHYVVQDLVESWDEGWKSGAKEMRRHAIAALLRLEADMATLEQERDELKAILSDGFRTTRLAHDFFRSMCEREDECTRDRIVMRDRLLSLAERMDAAIQKEPKNG